MNGFTVRDGYHGIHVLPESRAFRDVLGSHIPVSFEILDRRPGKRSRLRTYTVTMFLDGQVWFNKTYTEAGTYTEHLLAPSQPDYGNFRVEMYNEHFQYFHDSFTVGMNVHYYRLLKWMVLAPFAVMFGILMFVRTLKPALPT